MKKILFVVALAVSALSVNAQDILVRKGGDVENVKVLEVTPTEVKYKKASNVEGPTFTERRSNLISVKYANGEVQKFNDSSLGIGGGEAEGDYAYYAGYGKDKRMTNELSLYVGDGYGLGYQLRREFSPYIAWNIFGMSIMTADFVSPDEGFFLNFKLLGVRGYTPSWKWIRGYADLNLGYTMGYTGDYSIYINGKKYGSDGETTHHFGLDFSVGIQVHKKIAIGYNLNYTTPGEGKIHMCRISFPF